jgi:catechol-2,3-dioxygenase
MVSRLRLIDARHAGGHRKITKGSRAEPIVSRRRSMRPTKLSHVVFQTNRKTEMQEWYCEVLGAHVTFENAQLGFITYDDEHHRVAFVDFGPQLTRYGDAERAKEPPAARGLHHVAFTFGSIEDLLATYRRLATRGIRPYRAIDHGPTTSMYYADPDGNRVELQVDNFESPEEATAWMSSPAFAANPIGQRAVQEAPHAIPRVRGLPGAVGVATGEHEARLDPGVADDLVGGRGAAEPGATSAGGTVGSSPTKKSSMGVQRS